MSGMKILEEVAKKQFGAVSRQQVVAALVHRSSIASKVKTGQLERVHELAYRLRGAPETWQRRGFEALFIGGDGSALSHQTAAWLHGLDGFVCPKLIDVSVLGSAPRPVPSVRFHRSEEGPGRVVFRRTLPVTSLERTIVDIAGELSAEELELALDSAQRRYRQFGTWLDREIKDLKPRQYPGLSMLLDLLKVRRSGPTDSALEVKVLRKLRDAGLLAHLTQYEVYDLNGDSVMRLDFCWPHLKVALHVDGFRWHAQRERFDRDARQRSRLSALGWRTVTVTFNTFADGSWLNDLLTLLNPQSVLALQ